MKPFIYGHWHVWQGVNSILVSDERTMRLRSFENTDNAINWLWLHDHKEAARKLNEHVKAH